MENSQRDMLIDQALRALQGGDPTQAYTCCQTVLQADEGDAEAWSIMGMALAGGEKQQSMMALQRAVQLEPGEPRWHIHLGLGYSFSGQIAQAEPVLARAAELSNYAPDAVLPWSDCLTKLGRSDEAISALKKASEANPGPQIFTQLSKVLTDSGDLLGAVRARESAFTGREMPKADTLEIINMHVVLSQYDKAQNYVDTLLSAEPSAPDVVLPAANLMRWRGELEQAHELLTSAYAKNDNDAGLLLALLDLNKDKDARHIDQAKTCIEQGQAKLASRRGLAFVLARLADKAGNYDEAWHYGQVANGLYDDGVASDVPAYKKQLALGLELYKKAAPQNIEGDAKHLYVVGPPRSGGSLLQTILAAHPGLESVGERGALMGWILPILTQSKNADEALKHWDSVAADLPLADTAGMTRSYPGDADRTFVDKMPHHAHVVGLLERLHPGAGFVDVRRDPHDITMSILFHDFSDKFGYSRSVSDIADYLAFQRSAISAWQEAGVPIIEHNHGAFLDAPQDTAKALFAKLGLTWDDEYLDPKSRQSTVRTFSALQVRSKVTKAYSGRGQHYLEFMGESAERLGALLT